MAIEQRVLAELAIGVVRIDVVITLRPALQAKAGLRVHGIFCAKCRHVLWRAKHFLTGQ